MSDPFRGMLTPVVQALDLSALRRQHVINQYAQHHIADPTLSVADRRDPAAVGPALGDDGCAMTVQRRAELMQGRRTAKDIGDEQRATNKPIHEIHDYRYADVDIQRERLGAAAEAARLPWRVMRPNALVQPFTPVVPVASAPKMDDVSHCCYSAPCVYDGPTFWHELSHSMAKVAADTPLGLSPTEVWMSTPIRALVDNWRGRSAALQLDGATDRLFDLFVALSDRLENEVRVYADTAAGTPRRYAAVFIQRELYEGLSIDVQVATERLPVVQGEHHG